MQPRCAWLLKRQQATCKRTRGVSQCGLPPLGCSNQLLLPLSVGVDWLEERSERLCGDRCNTKSFTC